MYCQSHLSFCFYTDVSIQPILGSSETPNIMMNWFMIERGNGWFEKRKWDGREVEGWEGEVVRKSIVGIVVVVLRLREKWESKIVNLAKLYLCEKWEPNG